MEQSEKVFREFIDLCRDVTRNDTVVLDVLQKRYNSTDIHFLRSNDFLNLIDCFSRKILANLNNKYVAMKEFTTELKAHKAKPLKHLRETHVDSSPTSKRESSSKRGHIGQEKNQVGSSVPCHFATTCSLIPLSMIGSEVDVDVPKSSALEFDGSDLAGGELMSSVKVRKGNSLKLPQCRVEPRRCQVTTIDPELSSSDRVELENLSTDREQPLSEAHLEEEAQKDGTSLENAREGRQNEGRVRRSIAKSEALLKELSEKITKLQKAELSLDDMDKTVSSYILESRYKKQFIKVWSNLCQLKGQQTITGFETEWSLSYEGTCYPVINRKISQFVNKYHEFPKYSDIREIIEKCNIRYGLEMRKPVIEHICQNALIDVRSILQKRRMVDLNENLACHLTDSMRHDPAKHDSILRKKLEENAKPSKSYLDKVINKYAKKEEEASKDEEDDGEGEEEADTEEEEATEEEEVKAIVDGMEMADKASSTDDSGGELVETMDKTTSVLMSPVLQDLIQQVSTSADELPACENIETTGEDTSASHFHRGMSNVMNHRKFIMTLMNNIERKNKKVATVADREEEEDDDDDDDNARSSFDVADVSFIQMTKFTFVLPELSSFSGDFEACLYRNIIDTAALVSLEQSGHLNWWADIPECGRLLPLVTKGDGNCLLHAASLAMWGLDDSQLVLRKLLCDSLTNSSSAAEAFKRRWRCQQSAIYRQCNLVLTEEEWESDWRLLLQLSSSQQHSVGSRLCSRSLPRQESSYASQFREKNLVYNSLEEMHVFVLANVLHRPIIVIAKTILQDMYGDDFAPIPFGGIYLPFERDARQCHSSPLLLTYDLSHFCALVATQVSSPDGRETNSPSLPKRVPLFNSQLEFLPLHFPIDPGPQYDFTTGCDFYLSDQDVMNLVQNYFVIEEIRISPGQRELDSDLEDLETTHQGFVVCAKLSYQRTGYEDAMIRSYINSTMRLSDVCEVEDRLDSNDVEEETQGDRDDGRKAFVVSSDGEIIKDKVCSKDDQSRDVVTELSEQLKNSLISCDDDDDSGSIYYSAEKDFEKESIPPTSSAAKGTANEKNVEREHYRDPDAAPDSGGFPRSLDPQVNEHLRDSDAAGFHLMPRSSVSAFNWLSCL